MASRVHLINPSDLTFGVAVITPRWLYVLAAATGSRWGDPHLVDETLDHVDPADFAAGDVVGIGIHTGNALRGYAIGRLALERPDDELVVGTLGRDRGRLGARDDGGRDSDSETGQNQRTHRLHHMG